MAKTRTYFCIDMKSFYASVECAERGYNPFETNLVVADLTRGKNALCLAITPAMKAQGIRNRCRLSEIPSNVKYEVAPPRMALYIEYAADIYSLYLDYFDPRDIHVYSIDESFLDVTDYLAPNHMDAVTFAKHLMNEIADRFHIPATAGIGTNGPWWRIARSSAMIVATAPSIRSVLFSLSGLMLPAGSVRT